MTDILDPSDWQKLIKDFENQRMVLLLGRSLAKMKYNEDFLPLNEIFALHLAQLLTKEEVEYEKSHERHLSYIAQKFISQPRNKRTDLEDQILHAYKQHTKEIPLVYSELAKLPFHLIINTLPDDLMLRALKEEGKFATQQSYNFKNNNNAQIGRVSADTPLVYNIFGSFDDPESLILTEKDRVDFFRHIIKDEPPVPPKVISMLDNRTTYLFFEFNLEEWPFRLLFDGLNLQDNSRSLTPKHKHLEWSLLTSEYYKEHFNFTFINHEAHEFTKQLCKQFKAEKSNNQEAPTKKKRVFISYSNEDETYLNDLLKNLRLLEQKAWISIWHRGMVDPGEDEETAIQAALLQADIVLLLVSSDFIADDAVFKREVLPSLERVEQDKHAIIPILIRSCSWEMAAYGHFPPLPDTKQPVNHKDWGSSDFAYSNIVNGIQKLLS